MTDEQQATCPNCKKPDKVEKVSKIVADSTSTTFIDGAESVTWYGQTYYYFLKNNDGKYVMPLAQKLLPIIKEPPKFPNLLLGMLISTSIWLFIGIVFIFLGVVTNATILSFIGYFFLCFFVITLILNLRMRYLLIKNNWESRAIYEDRINKIEDAAEKWSKLYYCYRCDGIFVDETEFVPVGALDSFLFKKG